MDDPHLPAPRVVVTVVRTGGIAGMRRQWRAQPAADETARWRELVAACPWEAPAPSPAGADRYTWHICADDDGASHEADVPDSGLEGPWRTLVDAVRGAAS